MHRMFHQSLILIFIFTHTSYATAILDSVSFPAKQFFNLSDDNTPQFRYQFSNFLHRRVCSGNHCAKTCKCDVSCMIDRSCCIDYLWNELEKQLNFSKERSLDRYLDLLVQKSKSYKPEECRAVFEYAQSHGYVEPWMVQRIKMIATCPKYSSKNEHRLCLDTGPSNHINIPIIGSDGYIYMNQYCAICNNILTYSKLDILVRCENAQNMTDPSKLAFNFGDCLLEVIPPNGQKRSIKPCRHIFNRQCDVAHPYYDLCRSYAGEIGGYANLHCLRCNNKTFDINEPFLCNGGSGVRPKVRSHAYMISFSSGTDVTYWKENDDAQEGKTKKASPMNKKTKMCPPGEIFDISQTRCVTFQCAAGYEISDSTCRRRFESGSMSKPIPLVNKGGFDRCLLLSKVKLLMNLGHQNPSTKSSRNLTEVNIDLSEQPDYPIPSYATDTFLGLSSTTSIEHFINTLSNISSPQHSIWKNVNEIYLISQGVHYYDTLMYGFNLSRHFRSGICAVSFKVAYDSMDYKSHCFVEAFRSIFLLDNITQWIEIRPGSITRKMYVCKAFHLQSSCPLKIIPPSNFSHEHNSTSIKLNSGRNKTLRYFEYLPLPSGVGVCIESGPNFERYLPSWLSRTHHAEYLLTIIGIPLSMICYVWIILTYTLIRKLRSIPSFNISALCTALLLSDVVFLVIMEVQSSDTSCKILAIFLHWLLLQVQAWSAIIAVEVARRFGSRVHRSRIHWRRFGIYVVAAMACSTSVVVVMVILDETLGNIGYGKGGVCWIFSLYSRIFGYIFFVGCVTLGAGALLVYVLATIHREHKQASHLLKKSGGKPIHIAKIALKLIILVGTAEIIGFIQITSPKTETEDAVNATFRILYAFLRSFRGLFIWLMYIASSTVWKHYTSLISEFSSKFSHVSIPEHSEKFGMAEFKGAPEAGDLVQKEIGI